MPLLDRLERRFRRWAIPNLTVFIIAGQAVLYIAALLPQGVAFDRITLNPARVLQGEAWRLATFLFVPPSPSATPALFAVFYFLLLHLFGTTLERQWGEFRYNLFVFVGAAANIAAAFAAYFIIRSAAGPALAATAAAPLEVASNSFLYGSLFLAFARLYPDFLIHLFFILPIRIKWLALAAWIGYGYTLIVGDWMTRMLVLATVCNYLLFFGREHWTELRQGQRRRSFQSKARSAAAPPKHKCRVCARSTDDEPRTLFRYCTKCAGQCCYCPDHIRDHEHVAAEESPTKA